MAFRDKFKKKKALLSRQHTQQIKNKDTMGSYPSIIRKDKLPPGVEMWRCDASDHIIDIIPFYAGPDFPVDTLTGAKIIEEGDPVYVLDLQVHTNVGPMKVPFVCPHENFGLPCPICEFIKSTRLEKDDWKLVKPKRKTLYLIWDHDSREKEKKGLYVWDASHFIMEEKLNVIAKLPKGGGAIDFADPDDGKSIAFTKQSKGGTNVSYLGHRLVEREMPIPEKLLDMTFPLDSIVHMHPTYEEIEKAFLAQKSSLSSSEDIDEAGSTFSGRATDDDVPDWMKTDEEEEVKPPVKKSIKKPLPKRKVLLKRK